MASSKPHLERYLDEFVFRWNRRRHTRTAFDTLLRLVIRLPHASLRTSSTSAPDPLRQGESIDFAQCRSSPSPTAALHRTPKLAVRTRPLGQPRRHST